MSLATILLHWISAQLMSLQHQPLSTLLLGKYKVIAETCQMTMNYVLLTRMSEAILTKKDYDFNDTKTDLIESGKHGRLLKVLGNCVFQVVLESYAVQT